MILLDTHIWVRWVDAEANPLPSALIETIETADRLAVSAITCWEVAWLTRRGRLDLRLSLADWLQQALEGSDVMCLPIDRRIAARAANLPEHHRDPADRLIIATAIETRARLMSLDGAFPAYFESPGTLIGS
ncbi:type II toxin-antitoxin system VapC family toxin [Thiobaca trueperi]|uniref:Ribonuclease VapC n=1 Tax=Thiobaca trueperi TaxID=127458 RepID=A0A4R3MQW8_9GAMM|nr:type II toxin-antitoxin system VapC family toxin [Thiobaca trueperi]TCT18698.1 PIN domain nuclease of toxin-antitoxin system [Thiobaca trueperi]